MTDMAATPMYGKTKRKPFKTQFCSRMDIKKFVNITTENIGGKA